MTTDNPTSRSKLINSLITVTEVTLLTEGTTLVCNDTNESPTQLLSEI